VVAAKTFSGDIEGPSTIAYTMAYGRDGTACVVGVERLAATIGERTGTLLLRHVGGFAEGAATATIEIVGDHGTGDFATVGGSGTMRADPAGIMKLSLDA
jgi:hypothetical protein